MKGGRKKIWGKKTEGKGRWKRQWEEIEEKVTKEKIAIRDRGKTMKKIQKKKQKRKIEGKDRKKRQLRRDRGKSYGGKDKKKRQKRKIERKGSGELGVTSQQI